MSNGTTATFKTLIERHAETVAAIAGREPVEFVEQDPNASIHRFITTVDMAARALERDWCRDGIDLTAAARHLRAARDRHDHPTSQRKLLQLAAARLDRYKINEFVA
ncbi:hypothetical protein ACFU0X_35140 [Streptomyces cellulosae]|uniref:Uncharacterized protein n=1 Tax=Streptomyces cellulosae TaxID=1968 RepID=A0ABW6JV93_STRCE